MSDFDALFDSIRPIIGRMQDLQRQAAQQYKPVVDDFLRSRCRDAKQIDHTLNGLLDFCGYEPVLQLYKRLCRHYWGIDPAATTDYIKAYREHWDKQERGRAHE